MFYVKDTPLLVDEMEVLYKLKFECDKAGMGILNYFRISSNTDIMTTCPFHKQGQEKRASFGISIKEGVCHCFTCGWTGRLNEMISQIFGYDDNGKYGDRWLSNNFLSYSVESRPQIEISDRRSIASHKNNFPGFTEDELDRYRYFHKYMFERGLNEEIINEFDIGYDSDTCSITFPVYDIDRTPLFIARRSVKNKYFNLPKDIEKPVYAGEKIVERRASYAVVCESVFNALTCWKWGIPAVALFGTGAFNQYQILKNLPVRKYILALDPDEAGERGRVKLKNALRDYKLITEYKIPKGKDINDLDSEVLNLVEYF